MCAEQRNEPCRERDRASAPRSLELDEPAGPADRLERVSYVEHALIEVDSVRPPEPQCLTLAQATTERHRDERTQPMSGNHAEKVAGLLRRERLDLLSDDSRWGHQRRNIARDHAPAHRLIERPPEHSVNVLDRARR